MADGPRDRGRRAGHRSGPRRGRVERGRGGRARRSRPSRSRCTLLNKPAGVVSTARDTHGRPTVVELVRSHRRLYPVGRLDADSHRADPAHERRRRWPSGSRTRATGSRRSTARASRRAGSAPRALRALREGVELDDGMTAPARVRQAGGRAWSRSSLREGRKRQVRRMCEAVGHRVDRRSSAWRSGRSGCAASARARAAGSAAREVERLRRATDAKPPPRGRRGARRRDAERADGRIPPREAQGAQRRHHRGRERRRRHRRRDGGAHARGHGAQRARRRTTW